MPQLKPSVCLRQMQNATLADVSGPSSGLNWIEFIIDAIQYSVSIPSQEDSCSRRKRKTKENK